MNAMDLEQRRRELGMTVAALAGRSGVPETTVHRVLRGAVDEAAFSRVAAIAAALGMDLSCKPMVSAFELQQKQAREKARKLVSLVQGSAGLESQAVSREHLDQMIERTVHTLMAGSKRRLWAE